MRAVMHIGVNARVKTIPVDATKTYEEWRYSSNHSEPRRYMEVSGQRHTPNALPLAKKKNNKQALGIHAVYTLLPDPNQDKNK